MTAIIAPAHCVHQWNAAFLDCASKQMTFNWTAICGQRDGRTPAASTRYAASAATPAASAVPALMSSTPISPSIRTSEPILRYRRLGGGDGVGHPVTQRTTRRRQALRAEAE